MHWWPKPRHVRQSYPRTFGVGALYCMYVIAAMKVIAASMNRWKARTDGERWTSRKTSCWVVNCSIRLTGIAEHNTSNDLAVLDIIYYCSGQSSPAVKDCELYARVSLRFVMKSCHVEFLTVSTDIMRRCHGTSADFSTRVCTGGCWSYIACLQCDLACACRQVQLRNHISKINGVMLPMIHSQLKGLDPWFITGYSISLYFAQEVSTYSAHVYKGNVYMYSSSQ